MWITKPTRQQSREDQPTRLSYPHFRTPVPWINAPTNHAFSVDPYAPKALFFSTRLSIRERKGIHSTTRNKREQIIVPVWSEYLSFPESPAPTTEPTDKNQPQKPSFLCFPFQTQARPQNSNQQTNAFKKKNKGMTKCQESRTRNTRTDPKNPKRVRILSLQKSYNHIEARKKSQTKENFTPHIHPSADKSKEISTSAKE